MIGSLFAPSNAPFAVALLVMLGIALIEGVGMMVGVAVSRLVDSVIPDALSGPDSVDVDMNADMDTDIDADVDAGFDGDAGADVGAGLPHVMTEAIGWLRIGQVPFLVYLIVLLTSFGLIGLFTQSAVTSIFGAPLPASLAIVPAGFLSLPVVRVVVGVVARVMPKVETSAVSRGSFVGGLGIVVTGTAETGAPAQARLIDRHGQAHYVLVEPDIEGERFETGATVLLVSGEGAVFRVIHPPSDALLPS
ncbi:MAG: YqiJ family protein [Alphaproteobacteria bacterium]|nr:YqiJ family protein [Alphaproteobacteria bacterium]